MSELAVEDVKSLLEGLTPGDWCAVVFEDQATLGFGYAQVCGPVVRVRDHSVGFSPADAKIMASAPALARLVLQQRDRYLKRLEQLSEGFLALDEIDHERARLVCEVVSQIDGKNIRPEDAIARIQEIYGVTP